MDTDVVRNMLKTMYNNQLAQGMSNAQTKAFLKAVEPFNNYEDLIDEL